MAHPALPQPEPGLPPGRLIRLATAINGVVRTLRRTTAAEYADDFFERLASHDASLDRMWPGTHPATTAEEAREHALQVREKALRSQERITAAQGWAAVFSKVLMSVASAAAAIALVLHVAGIF
jgi:hypothetical protein